MNKHAFKCQKNLKKLNYDLNQKPLPFQKLSEKYKFKTNELTFKISEN